MAFDGDGDRIGVVDGTGAILWPDQLLLLLARDQLRRTPGAAIVADVKSSRVLFDGIAAAGGQALMGPSGYVLVRERMLAERSPLAGEMSGHIFYADGWTGTDDALHVALRLLAALGRSGESLAAFRASLPPTVATPELRLACPDARKAAVLAKVAARLAEAGAVVDRTDGLRVTTGDGWWLLRASGTEPKLTARCEAADEAGLERLKAALFAELRASGMADPD
jgi:phosphomannomutase